MIFLFGTKVRCVVKENVPSRFRVSWDENDSTRAIFEFHSCNSINCFHGANLEIVGKRV